MVVLVRLTIRNLAIRPKKDALALRCPSKRINPLLFRKPDMCQHRAHNYQCQSLHLPPFFLSESHTFVPDSPDTGIDPLSRAQIIKHRPGNRLSANHRIHLQSREGTRP